MTYLRGLQYQVMRIFLARHGQSEANLQKIIQGTMDSPLTELGRRQAMKLRELLPNSWDRIYLSPLIRAKMTGLIATGTTEEDPRVIIDPRLQEIEFGDLQGMKYINFPSEDVKAHLSFTRDVLNGDYGAERISHFLQRTHQAFEEIVQEIEKENWQSVAIFSHGGVLRSISQHYLELSSEKWGNCEYGVLSNRNGKWELKRYSDHIQS